MDALCTSSAGFLFRIDKSWCVCEPTKWGVPRKFLRPQRPSISFFQQVQWWDLLMDKGSIATDITEKVATNLRFLKCALSAWRSKCTVRIPNPHTDRTITILLDIFRWMQKDGRQTFDLGKSPYFFRSDRWRVLFLLILFLVLLLLFCPGQPSPKLSMVLHHNLCGSQPCAMNSWKKATKKKVVSSGTESRPLPFLARQCGSGYEKNRIKPFTVKLPREESKQPTPPENSCDSCMERRFLRLLKPRRMH